MADFKHLLVHVDSSDGAVGRLELAVTVARRFGSKLTGLFAETDSLGASVVARRSPQNVEKAKAKAKALFESVAVHTGIETEWWQVDRADYSQMIGWTVVSCRYVDLAIFGQHDPRRDSALPEDLVEQVLFNCGRPVLVVPYFGRHEEIGKRIVVGWTGSREAARAVSDAMPLLEAAEEVRVLALQQRGAAVHTEGGPAVDIAAHLRTHGVDAQYERIFIENIGAVANVLNGAAESAADLVVIGGHEQNSLPLLQRGSTTRDLLRSMVVPVLLSY